MATVLAITDLPSSPLARYSAQFRPIAGSIALIQALMMSLGPVGR